MKTETKKYVQIMTNRPKDPGLQVSNYIKEYLEKRGAVCTIYADNETAEQIRDREGSNLENVSCMIVLGGDGTLLKAARETFGTGIPLLGVNLGTVGYLAEVERSGLDSALERILNHQYVIEDRMMLSACVIHSDPKRETPEEEAKVHALNEVAITRRGPMQVVRLRVWVNGQVLAGYSADGIVIATPTGSTGYNMSAGGPIVEPGARLILLTPICPHTLNSRSIILGAEDVIEIEVERRESGQEQEVEVSFDGNAGYLLRTGDRVRVWRSSRTTSIMKLSEGSFLQRLHRKMSE